MTFFDIRRDDVRLKFDLFGVGVIVGLFVVVIGVTLRDVVITLFTLPSGLSVVVLGVDVLFVDGGEKSSSNCRFAERNGS